MSDIEKTIYRFIIQKYLKEGNCRKIKIKKFYKFNKLIDKILNLKSRNSFIIKVITPNNTVKRLFAIEKKHHDESGPEYEILEGHWRNHYSQSLQFKIPKPFGWIPEHKILLVEKIEGLLLSNILIFFLLPGVYLFTMNFIYENLALAIDWLIDFQQYTLKDEPFDFVNLFNITKEKTKNLSQDWQDIAKSLLSKFDHSIISVLDVPQVDWHGDFLHRNIFIKKKTVTVFDWEGHWKFNSLHPLFELYRFIFNIFFLIKVRPIYSLKKIKEIANWVFQYYINRTYFKISFEGYKAIYNLFLIFMIYNYDKQVSGLCLVKTKRNNELLKKIFKMDFEELFYAKQKI